MSQRLTGTTREEKRRVTHNEVERRRRDKINNWICRLAKIIPDCPDAHPKSAQVKGVVWWLGAVFNLLDLGALWPASWSNSGSGLSCVVTLPGVWFVGLAHVNSLPPLFLLKPLLLFYHFPRRIFVICFMPYHDGSRLFSLNRLQIISVCSNEKHDVICVIQKYF